MKRVLITGATGFVGKNLARHLRARNYYTIGLSRRDLRQDLQELSLDESVQHDFVEEESCLSLKIPEVEYIVHLSGNAHQSTELDYEEYYKVNILATEKLLKSAQKMSIKKFIYISTIKVNGDITKPGEAFTESMDYCPSDKYSKSKYQAELITHTICTEASMKYVILRPPLIFGPGVKANFRALMAIVKTGVPLPFSGIKNKRSFVYVDNFSDLVEKCLSSMKVDNNTYLVKDISISLPELLRALKSELASKTVLFYCPLPILNISARLLGKASAIDKLSQSLVIDDSKIRKHLEWTPPKTFPEAIRQTVRWYQSEG